jgi:Tol biopolymer transport system component/tRNA A-37 threonylcarbamoyl transferase component Bud32
MSLMSGAKLGPYEILAPLGAGGMGEVYRAKDTRLDREVAIKVLPAHLSRSPEFKQRFEREAKSISQLTHAHICTLHDVGHHEGTDYLVMELLEGETVAQRVTKGPLPLDAVLTHGVEIASALDAAHRKGVVHRDLKPGNVMLTKTGAKLLDFGLAKSATVMDNDPSAVTISQPLTSKGTILGTFQYMAPEQLEGIEADARTDIFAFGAVLYEMATGKRAFEGHSRASLIASIMSSYPRAISELQPMTPLALDRLIRKCLAKDPDARWQSGADVADVLRCIADGGSLVGMPAALRSARRFRERLWIAGALVVAAASLVFALLSLSSGTGDARKVWSIVPAPDETTLMATGDLAGPVVISPDGTTLAFVALGKDAQRLWVRPLNGPTARVLPGTEGATFPFWSADSRTIGYFAKEKLYTVSAGGGPPISVCDAPGGRGGAWNREGVILFSPAYRSGVLRVTPTGGKPVPVTTLDETKHTSHRWPAFCPDGKHFLYLAVAHGAAQTESNAVYLASLDGGEPKLVMHGSANAAQVTDYLLFPRENTLQAAPFDVKTARMLGDPMVVATEVMYDVTVWRAGFSASDRGVLTFHTGTAGGEIQLVRRDRAGKDLGKIADPGNFGSLSLSPDGKKVATDISGAETDVWIYDVARGVRSRLTFGNAANLNPVWSPDGQSLVYASIYLARPEATHRISRRPAMGGDEEVLYTSNEETWVTDWSSDGKYLLLSKGKYIGGNPCDIWVLPLLGERIPFPLMKTPFLESNARFSPDGKWVAYDSNETGQWEVYIVPFNPPSEDPSAAAEPIRGGPLRGGGLSAGEPQTDPSAAKRTDFVGGGKWQVSTHGGVQVKWRGNGKEVFFVSGDSKIRAVEISVTNNGLEIGAATSLYQVNQPAGIDPFDVSPDGEWFVVNTSNVQGSSPINLIVNWEEGLKNDRH